MKKSNKEKKEKLPFDQRHPKLNLLFGFILLLTIAVIIVLFTIWLIKTIGNGVEDVIDWSKDKLSKLDSVVLVALITGSVSLIGVLFTSVISKIIEYKQKRRDYLNQKREKAYGQFVDMFFKMHENAKGITTYEAEDVVADLFKFSRELTLWGSNTVVKLFVKYRTQSNKMQPKDNLYLFEKILFAMRKDMGFKKMKKGTLLKFVINDLDKDNTKQEGEK